MATLRVLLVEDSEDDAALLVRELKRGFDPIIFARVETETALAEALARGPWDLVITDFTLPLVDGPSALRAVKATGLDIPVIMMSGSIDEEAAIDSLIAGAADFVAKGRLARLVPAVVRELRESEVRRGRARALDALRQSEEHHRILFEESPLPALVFDVETRRFLDVNEAAITHYGYAREEFLARKLDDLWLPEDAAAHIAELATTRGVVRRATARRQRKRDGMIIEVEMASHEILRAGRTVRMSVISDVTERKALEAKLRQAQKIEAIGQLASGIAHDFNNVLSVILSFASLTAEQLPEGSPIREDVDEIAHAAQRGSLLTQQLLAFGRHQEPQVSELDVNATILQLAKMMRRTMQNSIELVTDLAPDAGAVLADPSQFEQVVLNLVLNARDAMPSGGRLAIRTARASSREVTLLVSDTGVGMSDDTKERLFEPFFTTKPAGQGTGLGLANVAGIVRDTGGKIAVESAPGRGTTFTVHLPRVPSSVSGEQRARDVHVPRT